MSKLFLLLFIPTLCATAWGEILTPTVSSNAVSLQDCYRSAKGISETLNISAENIKVVEEQYKTAIGSILPHISWVKTQEFQDQSASSGGGSNVASSFTRSPIPESYFHLVQPIYGGGRDWEAIKITKSQRIQAQLSRAWAEEQLLIDVATAFFTARSWGQQIDVLTDSSKLTDDRIKELNRFVHLGRSRSSEVLSAQTNLASLQAQIESARQNYADARQLLFFLSGVPPEIPLKDDSPLPPPRTLDEALSRAGKRPDLMATAETLKQTMAEVRYAKGGYLPTLGLTADYFTERVGFLSDVRWDAIFLLNVPLYEGGTTKTQTEQARSQELIAQLSLARQKRDVERQVRTAYNDLLISQSGVLAYEKAVSLADENYAAEKKEYRVGLINNLELLQLLENLQTIKQQSVAASTVARLNDVLLRVAMGEGLQ